MNEEKLNALQIHNLKTALKIKKFSQKDLAEASGFTPQYVNNILRGKKPMTLSAAKAFSKILDVRTEYLMGKSIYTSIDFSPDQTDEEIEKEEQEILDKKKREYSFPGMTSAIENLLESLGYIFIKNIYELEETKYKICNYLLRDRKNESAETRELLDKLLEDKQYHQVLREIPKKKKYKLPTGKKIEISGEEYERFIYDVLGFVEYRFNSISAYNECRYENMHSFTPSGYPKIGTEVIKRNEIDIEDE